MDSIHLQSPSGLFAGEERTVTHYPSGLLRVDQTYYCPAAYAATARTELAIGNPMPDADDSPATDGLYIFPAPQEIGGQFGMKEFRVSAYGRTTSESTPLQNPQLEEQRFTADNGSGTIIRGSVWKINTSLCIPTGTPLSIATLNLDASLLEPFNITFPDPALETLDVTELAVVYSSRSRYIRLVLSRMAGSTDYSMEITPPRRQWRARMTLDGETVATTATFWLEDPRILITSARPFGNFIEYDISTERPNTDSEII